MLVSRGDLNERLPQLFFSFILLCYQDEIVRRRALVHDTIYGHLCSALLAGFPVYLHLGKY